MDLCGGGDAACRCRYCSYSLFLLVAVVVTCDGICGFESAFHTSGRGGSDCAQQLAVLLAHCVRSTAFRLAIFIRLRPVARRSRDNLVRDRLFAFQSIALDATLLILINRSFILNAARPYIVSCFRCLRSVTVDISARSLLKFCSTRNFTMI